MKQRRNRLELINEILCIVRDKGPIKKTPLLRYSNLSSQRFKDYYGDLVNKGLIKEEDVKGRLHLILTDKGYRLVERYSQIQTIIDEFEL
jgi:predicted transcriptional regulator